VLGICDDIAVDGKLILLDGASVPVNAANVKDALAAGWSRRSATWWPRS
jgi:hypothetical protein